MLLIQRIVTEWTKRSRGGDGAANRNAVRDTFALPEFEAQIGYYVLHDLRFTEATRFTPTSRLRVLPLKAVVTVSPIRLHVTRQLVSARFTWTHTDVGAPEREFHTAFEIEHGQWAQFRCNGRFGAESTRGCEWGYRKSVINIAYGELIRNDIFAATQPTKSLGRMALLR